MTSHSIDVGLEYIDQSFSSECADLEVESIFVLASLKIEMKIAFVPRWLTKNVYEEDDDYDFSEDILILEEYERLLKA